MNHSIDFITASGNILVRAKQPVYQTNFTDLDRDKAFGFLLVYNYFRQLSTFLSVGSE